MSSSMDKKIILWDVEAAAKLLTMSGHSDCVYSCLFMPVSALARLRSTQNEWSLESGSGFVVGRALA